MKRVCIGFTLLAMTGCAAIYKPTPEQISRADYGSYPSDYKEVVQNYFSRVLIDPESARYTDWRGPSHGYVYDFTGCFFGYRVCVEVNAKNRLGGYTGSQPYLFVIKNGTTIKQDGGTPYGTIGADMVEKACINIYDSGNPDSGERKARKANIPKKSSPSLLSPPYEDAR